MPVSPCEDSDLGNESGRIWRTLGVLDPVPLWWIFKREMRTSTQLFVDINKGIQANASDARFFFFN